METAAQTAILGKVDALERYDYPRYLEQVKKLSSEEKKVLLSDWRLYRRAFLWIIEKLPNGIARPTRFHPRRWQLAYEGTRTANDVALKARKVGFSTDILTEMYAKAATRSHQKAVILSHEEDATRRLLDILKTAHDYNPMAQPTSQNNTQGIRLKYSRSNIYIGTAGARVFGRGDDLTMLHLSEAAHFYKKVLDAPNWMAGLLEAVAKGGRTAIESTSNGEDPIFYPLWQSAVGGELWHSVFLAFFMDENNDFGIDHPLSLPSTRNDKFELTPYEQLIMQKHQIGLGYIRFLRYEKARLGATSEREPQAAGVAGDERMLLQEYPVDDTSCFLISEDTVFDQNIVHLYRQRMKPPMFVTQSGALRVWERPLSGHGYVLALDTSEGLPTSTWQAAAILDAERQKYVATLRVRTDLADLSLRCLELCHEYNNALYMIERNNHGHVMIQLAQQSGYDNIYSHQEAAHFIRAGESRLGWPTRWADTKPLMINVFKELFEAGALEIHDEDALREIATFRHFDPRASGTGYTRDRYHAPKGGSDDLLMAMMMALQGKDYASSSTRPRVVTYGQFSAGGIR